MAIHRYYASWKSKRSSPQTIAGVIRSHFAPTPLDQITISERRFPARVRADLQWATDRLFAEGISILHFCGVKKEYAHFGVTLSDGLVESNHDPAVSIPPEYEEIDIGDE